MKTNIIIPARSGSKRLPYKHLYPLTNSNMNSFDLLHDRLVGLTEKGLVDKIIVSMPDKNPVLYKDVVERTGLTPFVSPLHENDVLGRLSLTAKMYPADRYVIVHGDSPLMCPMIVETIIKEESKAVKFVGPSGFRPWKVSKDILARWDSELTNLREHPSSTTLKPHPDFNFIKGPYVNEKVPNNGKFSLDTYDDVLWLRKVLSQMPTINENMENIIKIAEGIENG